MACCRVPGAGVSHGSQGGLSLVSASKKWPSNSTLRVFFYSFDEEKKDYVLDIARQWTRFTGVHLQQANSIAESHIRVIFGCAPPWSPSELSRRTCERPDLKYWLDSGDSAEDLAEGWRTQNKTNKTGLMNEICCCDLNLYETGLNFLKIEQQMELSEELATLLGPLKASMSNDFKKGLIGSAWSCVGIDALLSPNQPTMNLGFSPFMSSMPQNELDKKTWDGTILHEFGHALGFAHENPGAVPFDRTAVIKYYSGPPINWDKAKIETNLFKAGDNRLTEFDPESIMSYAIEEHLLDKSVAGWEKFLHGHNTKLSEKDKEAAAKFYGYDGVEYLPDLPRHSAISAYAGPESAKFFGLMLP